MKSRLFRRLGLALLAVIALVVGLSAWGHNRYLSGTAYNPVDWASGPTLAESLQAGVEADFAQNPWVEGISIYIHAPTLALDQGFVAGFADPPNGLPMTPEHAMRMASITKTYVAATALALSETGDLDLSAPLTEVISPETLAVLETDGYDTATITVEHLLTHRSGLADYAQLDAYLIQNILGDAIGRPLVWTRDSQIDFAMDRADPFWEPGHDFYYSDTGYIILGEAIERAMGLGLAQVVREALGFEALGLQATWWERLEPAPAGVPIARQFSGRADATDLDASIDLFGGGGLMATPQDIAMAMRAIVRGEVFRAPATRDLMQTRAGAGNYAHGIDLYVFEAYTCWGHSGYWGLIAFHCPDPDITVAMSYSQANAGGIGARANQILLALSGG